ncbi:unnamed protein product, partial [Brassica oleracea]
PVCTWIGVTCNRRRERVTSLNLGGFKLAGVISPSIGNLTSLQELDFAYNNMEGEIPFDVARLTQMVFFQVSQKVQTITLEF